MQSSAVNGSRQNESLNSWLKTHSDGTHSLQRTHCWVSYAMLSFSKTEETNWSTSWMAWGWVHFQWIVFFGWNIILKTQDYHGHLDVKLCLLVLVTQSVHRGGGGWLARHNRGRKSTPYPIHPSSVLCYWDAGTFWEVLLAHESETVCPLHQSRTGAKRSDWQCHTHCR